MILGVDIGNTHTRFTLLRGTEAVATLRMATWAGRGVDEILLALDGFLATHGGRRGLAGACVSSVVPAVDGPVGAALAGVPTHFVGHRSALGFEIDVPEPAQVGADRLVNAAGGLEDHDAPLVLVDAGTAITVCGLAPGPRFIGGAIAPGPGLCAEALALRGAKLPEVDLKVPAKAAGGTTVEAMQAGLIFGAAGAIEALVRRVAAEVGDTGGRERGGGRAPKVLGTGGALRLLAPALTCIDEVADDLTMRGLAAIARREGLVEA